MCSSDFRPQLFPRIHMQQFARIWNVDKNPFFLIALDYRVNAFLCKFFSILLGYKARGNGFSASSLNE